MFNEEPLLVDRRAAGRRLGELLADRHSVHPVVFALTPGAVPVAFEVARAVGGQLNLLLIERIGTVAGEAIRGSVTTDSSTPAMVLDLPDLDDCGVLPTRSEGAGVERRLGLGLEAFPPIDVLGRVAILVDDGMADPQAIRASLAALRELCPASLVFAVPVARADELASLTSLCDELICLFQPSPFYAAGAYYTEFHRVSDAEVARFLRDAWDRHSPPPPPLAVAS